MYSPPAYGTGSSAAGSSCDQANARNVADGDPSNAFCAILIRIGRGRDEETRKRVSQAVLATLADITADAFAKRGLSLSVEIQEIDEAGATRKNNLHERLKGKAG